MATHRSLRRTMFAPELEKRKGAFQVPAMSAYLFEFVDITFLPPGLGLGMALDGIRISLDMLPSLLLI